MESDSKKSLMDIFAYPTKGRAHKQLSYFSVYENMFRNLRNEKIKILEIGIQNGGSLWVWKEYFPCSEVTGIDINPLCKQFEGKGVSIHIGDQTNKEFLLNVNKKDGPFDIIIDDGAHQYDHVVTSFETLFPLLNINGKYIVEDVPHPYGDQFIKDKIKPIVFFKDLISNFQYTPDDKKDFERWIYSLHFYDNLIVIDKRAEPQQKFVEMRSEWMKKPIEGKKKFAFIKKGFSGNKTLIEYINKLRNESNIVHMYVDRASVTEEDCIGDQMTYVLNLREDYVQNDFSGYDYVVLCDEAAKACKDKINNKNIIIPNIKADNKFCILLTATIDPKGCIITERNDPAIREQDYMQALIKWLTESKLPIVFCENSMADLSSIRQIQSMYPDRVEIIQFDGNQRASDLGKGCGELKIMERALQESKFIKNSENVIKVSGRVFVPNFKKILNNFESDTFVQYSIDNNVNNYKTVQTMIFIFKKEFLSYLLNRKDELNDSIREYFEKVFLRCIHDAEKNGHKCVSIDYAKYDGYSGGDNTPYSEFINKLKRENVE